MQPLVLRKHAKNFFNLFLEVSAENFPRLEVDDREGVEIFF